MSRSRLSGSRVWLREYSSKTGNTGFVKKVKSAAVSIMKRFMPSLSDATTDYGDIRRQAVDPHTHIQSLYTTLGVKQKGMVY